MPPKKMPPKKNKIDTYRDDMPRFIAFLQENGYTHYKPAKGFKNKDKQFTSTQSLAKHFWKLTDGMLGTEMRTIREVLKDWATEINRQLAAAAAAAAPAAAVPAAPAAPAAAPAAAAAAPDGFGEDPDREEVGGWADIMVDEGAAAGGGSGDVFVNYLPAVAAAKAAQIEAEEIEAEKAAEEIEAEKAAEEIEAEKAAAGTHDEMQYAFNDGDPGMALEGPMASPHESMSSQDEDDMAVEVAELAQMRPETSAVGLPMSFGLGLPPPGGSFQGGPSRRKSSRRFKNKSRHKSRRKSSRRKSRRKSSRRKSSRRFKKKSSRRKSNRRKSSSYKNKFMRGGGSGATGGTSGTPPGGPPTGWYRQDWYPPKNMGRVQRQKMPEPGDAPLAPVRPSVPPGDGRRTPPIPSGTR